MKKIILEKLIIKQEIKVLFRSYNVKDRICHNIAIIGGLTSGTPFDLENEGTEVLFGFFPAQQLFLLHAMQGIVTYRHPNDGAVSYTGSRHVRFNV